LIEVPATMKFSITYPLVAHPCHPDFLEKANVIRIARAAEAAGFDALGFTDHPAPSQKWLEGGGHDALDPFAALAFCAAVTDRIRLMPHIVVLPYRNPFVLAKAIATVDVLSGGRFILGTAAGYLRSEYGALGVDFAERNELFDEAIEVLQNIWSNDDVRYQGRHFSAQGQTANPKPVQKPHPPIWIGGNSRLARRRVAKYGQGWMPFRAPAALSRTTKTPVLETPEHLARYLDELWTLLDEAGRDRGEIDIHYHNDRGGTPGRGDFDPDACQEGLHALAKLGVTWCGTEVPGDSVERAVDALQQFGETVIAPLRS
jgi:probable F420-dependent oxidoreductase